MIALDGTKPDGRRLRSADSRARIVAAMLELMYSGDVSPSAEHVATRADVGLRTVFRHFKDMDSLYREMTQVIEVDIRAVATEPFISTNWREKLIEFVGRRTRAYERFGPFKRALDVHRYRSADMALDSSRVTSVLRWILSREVPPEVAEDKTLFESLDLVLSFEAWNRLRRDQGLSAVEAREVLEVALWRLSAVAPD